MDQDIRIIAGELSARGLRFGIVAARFNDFIVDRLVDGAVDTLIRHGAEADAITLARVPGAFEIPQAVKAMAGARRHDAIVALGCVIRGATPHFDYVAGAAARGLAQVSMDQDIPVAFGVLTVDTIEQAIERAGTKAGNKGVDAAMSAIEMATLLRALDR